MTDEQVEYGLAMLGGIENALSRIADKIVTQEDEITRLTDRLETEKCISETQQAEIGRLRDALEIEKCISVDTIAKLDSRISELEAQLDAGYCPDCQCGRCWRINDE